MCAQNKKSCKLISVNANKQGRSVARCREPANVIYCYITILIQPEALISLLGESVLCPLMSPDMLIK